MKDKDDKVLKENYHTFLNQIDEAKRDNKKKKKEKKDELQAKKEDLGKKSNQSARLQKITGRGKMDAKYLLKKQME